MSLSDLSLIHIRRAVGVLTRLPVIDPGPLREAVWAFAIVGILVGGIQALIAMIALWIGLPPALAAGLAIVAGLITTGTLHEDGLADMADGCGAWTKERRLEIMRDSVIGSYGTLALIMAIGLRWGAITALLQSGATWPVFIVVATTSRAAMAGVMAALPPARKDGMSHSAGRPDPMQAVIAMAIAAALTAVLAPGAFIGVLICCGGMAAFIAWFAQSRLGGQTGDVLGATQVASEIAALLAMAAIL